MNMDKTKILIVEDESIVALDMKNTLTNFGYEVTNCVTNYNDAVNSVQTNKPELILMDINLGNGKDGINVAEEIQISQDIPIIYITAFADEKTINRAIKTNPVSYLIKPFKREELKSNIMLGLYKNKTITNLSMEKTFIPLGQNYYFEERKNRLYYKALPINLGSKEKELLKILVESKGKVVAFSDIEYKIWGNNTVSNSTLRTLIYRLRAKLEHKLIETIPNVGCLISG
ncbi:MAG: response regulator [Aliarcobacter sp.]|nr:response regulator [Aliarcobacter sp.]